MSKDIRTEYTKEQNLKNGRSGYAFSDREKVNNISPAQYGMFLSKKKGNSKKNRWDGSR